MSEQSGLKEKIKKQYGKIALEGNRNSCCMPSSGCCDLEGDSITPFESSKFVGYEPDKLKLIPESSVLGVGCGNPTGFADIQEGDLLLIGGLALELMSSWQLILLRRKEKLLELT